MTELISISCAFDGGNIEFAGGVDSYAGEDGGQDLHELELMIKDDPYTEYEKLTHKQWFYFRASGFGRPENKDMLYKFNIKNAGECSFPQAFEGYSVCASYDRKDWFRVPTEYTNGNLHWSMNVKGSQIYFAYFAPYSHERHLDLVAKCAAMAASEDPDHVLNKNEVIVRSLGNSLDGRSMDLITIGSGPVKIWANARQHPGETMAEWFMEGYLNRLLDENDPTSRSLRKLATFYCVPNMNPDGSFRGHLRTNAAGANLNREWATTGDYVAPTLERSPEVYHVLAEMTRVGCDMCMDLHGDEALPYNFILGPEALPVYEAGPRLKELKDTFCEAFEKANSDFQSVVGYDENPPKEWILCVGAKQIAERFDCLAFTLEMPFKDTIEDPRPRTGWNPDRCMKLGASMLDAVKVMVPLLRPEFAHLGEKSPHKEEKEEEKKTDSGKTKSTFKRLISKFGNFEHHSRPNC